MNIALKRLIKLPSDFFVIALAILLGIASSISFSGHFLLIWLRRPLIQWFLFIIVGGVFFFGIMLLLDRIIFPWLRSHKIGWMGVVAGASLIATSFLSLQITSPQQKVDIPDHSFKITMPGKESRSKTLEVVKVEADGETIAREKVSCSEECQIHNDGWILSGKGTLTFELSFRPEKNHVFNIRFLKGPQSGNAAVFLDDQPVDTKIDLNNAFEDYQDFPLTIPEAPFSRLLRATDFISLLLVFFFAIVSMASIIQKNYYLFGKFIGKSLDLWERLGDKLVPIHELIRRIPIGVYFLPLVFIVIWSLRSLNVWATIYLIGYLILAVGLGMFVYYLPKAFPLPGLSRFLAGASLSPFLIGGWLMGLVYLWPRSPRTFAAIGPYAIGLILIVIFSKRFFQRMQRNNARLRSSGRKIPHLALLLAVTYLLGFIVILSFKNTVQPIIGHDEIFYFSEAVPLARERTPESIQGITDAPDGTHRREYHTFFYPALIAHALLISPVDQPGPANDFAARMSLQVNLILMIASLAALGFSFRKSSYWVGLLSLFVFFLFARLGYLSYAHGRDTYRIIPILLFVALLIGISYSIKWKRVSWPALGAIFVVAGCAVHGHIIGLMNIALIGIAWALWMIINRESVIELIKVGITLLLSVALNGWRIFSFIYYYFLYEQSHPNGLPGLPTFPYIKGLITLFMNGGLLISIPVLIFCGLFVISMVYYRKKNWNQSLSLLVLITLVSLAYLLPVYKPFVGLPLENLFLKNHRYTLHWYPIASMVLACFLVEISRKIRQTRMGNMIGWSTFAVSLIVFSGVAFHNIQAIDNDYEDYTAEYFKIVSDYQTVLDKLPKGKKLLTNEDRYIYYLDNRVVLLSTGLTYKLGTTTDDTEVRAELQRLNISAVVWGNYDSKDWPWTNTAVFRYTTNPTNRHLFFRKHYSSSEFEADIVDPNLNLEFE